MTAPQRAGQGLAAMPTIAQRKHYILLRKFGAAGSDRPPLVSIDVLDVKLAPDSDASTQVDHLAADASIAREIAIGRIGITDKHHILIDNGRQTALELRVGDRTFAGDGVPCFPFAVTRHQDADLFARYAALVRRPLPVARPLLGLEQIHIIGFRDTAQLQLPLPVGRGQGQERWRQRTLVFL